MIVLKEVPVREKMIVENFAIREPGNEKVDMYERTYWVRGPNFW